MSFEMLLKITLGFDKNQYIDWVTFDLVMISIFLFVLQIKQADWSDSVTATNVNRDIPTHRIPTEQQQTNYLMAAVLVLRWLCRPRSVDQYEDVTGWFLAVQSSSYTSYEDGSSMVKKMTWLHQETSHLLSRSRKCEGI